MDALKPGSLDMAEYDAIITNPPWTREIMHPMIDRFRYLAPTWLLFDADWMHTKQAAPYMPYCSDIVSVGRLKWISGSKHVGKDNAAWYRFDRHMHVTRFHGRGQNCQPDYVAANDNQRELPLEKAYANACG